MDAEVRAWRVKERARLNRERLHLSSVDRSFPTEVVARNLDVALERRTCATILGLNRPIRGELGLGHGGGYFGRTLAVMRPKPLAVGIGTEAGRVESYIPQPHDIPMDFIVTGAAVHRAPPTETGRGA